MLGFCVTLLVLPFVTPTIAGSHDSGECTCINEKYSLTLSYAILFEQNLGEDVAKAMVNEHFQIFGNGSDGYSKNIRIMDNIEDGDFIEAVVNFKKAFCKKFKGDIEISDTLKKIYSGHTTFDMSDFLDRKYSGTSLKPGVVGDLMVAAAVVFRSTKTGESIDDLIDMIRAAGGHVGTFGSVVNCINKLVEGQTVTEKKGIWKELVKSNSILGDNFKL